MPWLDEQNRVFRQNRILPNTYTNNSRRNSAGPSRTDSRSRSATRAPARRRASRTTRPSLSWPWTPRCRSTTSSTRPSGRGGRATRGTRPRRLCTNQSVVSRRVDGVEAMIQKTRRDGLIYALHDARRKAFAPQGTIAGQPIRIAVALRVHLDVGQVVEAVVGLRGERRRKELYFRHAPADSAVRELLWPVHKSISDSGASMAWGHDSDAPRQFDSCTDRGRISGKRRLWALRIAGDTTSRLLRAAMRKNGTASNSPAKSRTSSSTT